MKRKTVVFSLALSLFSPLALGQIALAQVTPATAAVAQSSSSPELNAYHESGYSYYDALVLRNFWGGTLDQTKATIGSKLLDGPDARTFLSFTLTEARDKALANAKFLKLFIDAGYTSYDAQVLAEFWGDQNVLESKLRIERNLALGNGEGVERMLKLARRNR